LFRGSLLDLAVTVEAGLGVPVAARYHLLTQLDEQ